MKGIKKLKGQQYYLVQQKDQPKEYTSQEPLSNYVGVLSLIEAYKEYIIYKRRVRKE